MSERELVKNLGDQIGYGNMMWLAHELWKEMLASEGYPTSGAFIPTLPCDVAHCNNLPDKETPDRPPICGDCRYFKEQYKLNPQDGDFSCPGHCYLLQVPHPRSKYDPACMQIAPVSRVPSIDNEEHQTHKP